jgi:hypothetical protein
VYASDKQDWAAELTPTAPISLSLVAAPVIHASHATAWQVQHCRRAHGPRDGADDALRDFSVPGAISRHSVSVDHACAASPIRTLSLCYATLTGGHVMVAAPASIEVRRIERKS